MRPQQNIREEERQCVKLCDLFFKRICGTLSGTPLDGSAQPRLLEHGDVINAITEVRSRFPEEVDCWITRQTK